MSDFSASYYRYNNIRLSPRTCRFSYNGQSIQLRPKEYELLDFLLRNPNRLLNRLTILEYVWSYESDMQTNTLEVHIGALRRKLQRLLHKDPIETVYGMGYRFCL